MVIVILLVKPQVGAVATIVKVTFMPVSEIRKASGSRDSRALDITQKAVAVTQEGADRTPNATSERPHLSLVDPTVDPVEEWLTLYRDMNLREQIRAKERFIKEFCHDTSKDERLA